MSFFSSFSYNPFFSGVDPLRDPAFIQRPRETLRDRQTYQRPLNNNNNVNFDLFGDTFAYMQNLMSGVGQTIDQMHSTMTSKSFDGSHFPGVSYATSTMTSLNQENGGKPRIVETSSEEFRGPEGKTVSLCEDLL